LAHRTGEGQLKNDTIDGNSVKDKMAKLGRCAGSIDISAPR
jgi:hypothetical protein